MGDKTELLNEEEEVLMDRGDIDKPDEEQNDEVITTKGLDPENGELSDEEMVDGAMFVGGGVGSPSETPEEKAKRNGLTITKNAPKAVNDRYDRSKVDGFKNQPDPEEIEKRIRDTVGSPEPVKDGTYPSDEDVKESIKKDYSPITETKYSTPIISVKNPTYGSTLTVVENADGFEIGNVTKVTIRGVPDKNGTYFASNEEILDILFNKTTPTVLLANNIKEKVELFKKAILGVKRLKGVVGISNEKKLEVAKKFVIANGFTLDQIPVSIP